MVDEFGRIKSGLVEVTVNSTGPSGRMVSTGKGIMSGDTSFDISVTSTAFPKDFFAKGVLIRNVRIALAPIAAMDVVRSVKKFLLTPVTLSHVSRDDVISYHFRDRDLDQPFFSNYDTRIHNLVIKDVGNTFIEREIGFKFAEIYGCFIMFEEPLGDLEDPNPNLEDEEEFLRV